MLGWRDSRLETRDCNYSIDNEHYISNNLLKETVLNKKVKVAGLKFRNAKTFDLIGLQSMVSSVLCKRHNNMFGVLDEEIERFS